ncbi:hypothetical protein MRX96_033644 [Rhipicephalus microplus]
MHGTEHWWRQRCDPFRRRPGDACRRSHEVSGTNTTSSPAGDERSSCRPRRHMFECAPRSSVFRRHRPRCAETVSIGRFVCTDICYFCLCVVARSFPCSAVVRIIPAGLRESRLVRGEASRPRLIPRSSASTTATLL